MTLSSNRRMRPSDAIRLLNQLHAENRAALAAGLPPIDPMTWEPKAPKDRPKSARPPVIAQPPTKKVPSHSEIYEIDVLFDGPSALPTVEAGAPSPEPPTTNPACDVDASGPEGPTASKRPILSFEDLLSA